MTSEHDDRSPEEREEEDRREVHQRLALPFLIPAIAFLFAMLAIYGLSRIYLDLADFEAGDVNAATPLALGVALAILGGAWYLASNPNVTRLQMASMAGVAVALLLGGSIWAAVHEEDEGEPAGVVAPTDGDGGTPAPGGVGVSLLDSFSIELTQDAAPPGNVSFAVSNDGAILHNLRAIKTDLDPTALPTAGGAVDEDQVDVVAATSADLEGGETEEVTAADLEAASYVLICNIPGHYDAGMRVAFTVAEGAPAPEGGGEPPEAGGPEDTAPDADETPEAGAPEGAIALEMGDNFFDLNGEHAPAVEVPASEEVTISIVNNGLAVHNMHIAGADNEYGVDFCEAGGDEPCSHPDQFLSGDSGSITFQFDEAGTFDFRCDFHPTEMVGTIVVQ